MEYYEVELANSRDYDYTKGETVTLAFICNKHPEPKDIETYLKNTDSRFKKLKVCFISDPLSEVETKEIIPFVEEVISLD